MQKIILFLIIDSPTFQNYSTKFSSKKGKDKNKNFYYNYRMRILEQVNNFISLNKQFSSGGLIFFIIVNGYIISSFSSNSFRFIDSSFKEEQGDFFKLLIESLELSEIDREIKYLKAIRPAKKIFSCLNSVFFIVHELLKKLGPLKINIFCLAAKKKTSINHVDLVGNLGLCKRLNCVFSCITFNKNVPFLKFLTFFSGGFYCNLKKKQKKSIYCDKFLQILLNLFWINKFYRELFKKSILINSIQSENRISWKNSKKCGICYSVSTSVFSDCIICGNKHLFKFN